MQSEYYFDEHAAQHAVDFIEGLCTHVKGAMAGKPLILAEWEKNEVVRPLFGWKKKDGKRRYKQAWIEIPRKNNKMLCLNTPIPTPSGFKLLGDILEGDEIYSGEGDVCNVTGLSEINNTPESYEILFSNDEKIRGCGEHLWRVKTKDDIKYGSKHRIINTMDMIDILYQGKKRPELNISIDRPNPVDCIDKDLPIDPYLLGLWLGDGTTYGATITGEEEDLTFYISQLKDKTPYEFHIRDKSHYAHKRTPTLSITKGFQVDLKKNNLFGNKHIPDIYFSGSKKQRLQLLAGLLDSDGWIFGKYEQARFCNKIYSLAYGVWRLACSFGWKASIKTSDSKIGNMVYAKKHIVNFFPDTNNNPFLLPSQKPIRTSYRRKIPP